MLFACMAICLLPASIARAQARRDPLSPDEVEQLRKLAYQPDDRIKFYGKLLHERLIAIQLPPKPIPGVNTPGRAQQIHDSMQDFTSIADELEDTMDDYEDRHADMRLGLKELLKESPHWESTLKLPPPNSTYEFTRKEALDAASDLHDSVVELLAKQEKEMAAQKKQEKDH